ncbi:helix-turn-helix transcriptional regulator [Kitasatospora sp. NPDC096077]|uniref:helix-turn-helix transcriptional regulator n=1 Tax=Kitasatospora sp. NPDC096077 TaxID=3155544 RepID=UPI003320E1E7
MDAAAAAPELGMAEEDFRAALARLVTARLVEPGPGGTGHAVAPEVAAAQAVAPVRARIRADQEHVARVQEEMRHFAAAYGARTVRSDGLQVISSLPEVRELITRAADGCRREVLSCQPGGNRVPEALEDALARDRALLGRGVGMRTLYHHTARFNGPSQAYVALASALGAEYRTAHELFGRLIVFDRELAFLPTADESWGAVVVREPNTVAYLCEVFEQAWVHAKPFAQPIGQDMADVARELDRTILVLLAGGLKDEAIARRLGLSLRTARRHIADIMDQLGADSRFQAGANAARGGYLAD